MTPNGARPSALAAPVYAGSVRTAFRLFLVLLFLAVAAPAAIAITFWVDQSSVIARAEQSGALHQPENHLNTVERTIAIDQFSQTWGTRALPCRTLSLLWTDLSTQDIVPPSMPVSQRLATILVGNQHGASVRWQLSRLVVSCQLEQRYNDTRMFRAWLSTAFFGQNMRGVESAAQSVFAKPAAILNTEESAKLAALLHAPGLRNQPDRWARAAQQISARIAAPTH